MRRWAAGGLVVAAVLASACDSNELACTDLFATLTVVAVDTTNSPVGDAIASTTVLRTGQVLPVTSIIDLVPGHYVVVDDGARELVRQSGDSLRVTITKGAASGSAVLFVDVPNGCHVTKVSGADTLVLH